ncbi:MAG: Maf family protein, partial [Bdellovibrionota bacterium]
MTPSLYLASQSPRRKDLLQQAAIRFEVYVPKTEELAAPKTWKNESPAHLVKRIAEAKAMAGINELAATGKSELLVLAADTLVFMGKRVLAKPLDEVDAVKMLGSLSGKWHTVYTGVTVAQLKNGKHTVRSFSLSTKVKFFKLEKEQIRWYVATGEPMDKAGAYGAQGYGAALVEKFSGSYTNVVGLPLGHTL